ncbi:sensor domain-containing phosphodiesterase [Rhodanobacter sp. OR87]|uniref:putative bifunctional diguanylate cyclase/phosphodiesterase n=1 Tax=Rhodanobacter sp. OR87 TaxID=1076523 RepID=UPI000409A75F|nr:sensor domain-containing phosphodiesterase [Rhodanobacter sp. OR87]
MKMTQGSLAGSRAGAGIAWPAGDAEPHALPGFDAVARLAATTLGTPLVALLLADGSAFWYTPPGHGDPIRLDGMLLAACRQATRRGVAEVVPDARGDARFLPADADPAHATIGFFACEPVFALDGQLLGALFAVDRHPHPPLHAGERNALRDAASLAGTGAALRHYLDRTDPATGLPHRNAFFADLHTHLPGADDTAWLLAVEVAPVARFNAFVRAMGHSYADALMHAVAARVQAWMTPGMQLYQVGTARLALLPAHPHDELLPARLDEFVALLREPIDCLGVPLTLQPGVGLLKVEAHELRGGDPLRRVMNAAHVAQDSVRGWAVYDRTQDERQRQDFFLVTELAAALSERAELELHYQPRVQLASGRCVALEALARWRHPTLGAVPPGVFVPLAEQAGLMRSLTDWVLDHGLAQLAAWLRDGLDVQLSLNVSSADLDATLETRLTAAARRHAVPLARLELEFTESTAMRHSDANRCHLAALREAGVGIAIDDFGIGYSNLDALRQMPASCVKIDKSLVCGLDASRHDAAVVRSMVALAHELGFRVVMEGVETGRVLEAVRGMACDEVQGFHIAHPLPAADVAGWLREHASPPPADRLPG